MARQKRVYIITAIKSEKQRAQSDTVELLQQRKLAHGTNAKSAERKYHSMQKLALAVAVNF